MWGERAKDKSQYLSQLHTDYYNKVGHKYGLARGFSYDELSEEEKRGRKHKNKVVLEAERQAKVALDKVEKYAVQTHTFHLAVLMGGADQLTNWDGTQIAGLGAFKEKKTRDLSL
nr:hypothetical protein [uncultured Prevotella sp.]